MKKPKSGKKKLKKKPAAASPQVAAEPVLAADSQEPSAPRPSGDPELDRIMGELHKIDPDFARFDENRFSAQIAKGPSAVDALLLALESDDVDARADAAEALGSVGNGRALHPLRSRLQDADPEVRTRAAVALVQIGDDQLFPEVVKGLRDQEPESVVGAALILGRIGDKAVVPNLIEAFKTDTPQIGSAVAWALGQCGDPKALPWLITAVQNNFAAPNACEALGRIGDPKATSALVEALQSPSEDTRAYAARGLGMLKQRAAAGPMAAQVGLLAQNTIVPALTKALEDRSRKVRLCASIALYEVGEKAGGRHLVRELTGGG